MVSRLEPRETFCSLRDEDMTDRWGFRNCPQPLGVLPSSNRSGPTVGETAVTFEDGVVGGADFVEP